MQTSMRRCGALDHCQRLNSPLFLNPYEQEVCMVITQVSGGLGNQMFQYATARALERSPSGKVGLDLHPLKLYRNPPRRLVLNHFAARWQNVSWRQIALLSPREALLRGLRQMVSSSAWQDLAPRLERWGCGSPCRYRFYDYKPGKPKLPLQIGRVASERHFHFDPEVLGINGNVLLSGYWQTEKYFFHIANTLRMELQVSSPQTGQNMEVAGSMAGTNSVSLHVRRGDKAVAKDFNGTTAEYCKNAVDWFRQRLSSPVFFVFTDDWAWVREHLPAGPHIVHVDHNDEAHDYEDLRLMSQCRHHIIAPSSFSWWGAWLNPSPDKIVLSPPHQRWLNFPNCDTRDVIPDSWIQIDDR